MSLAERAVIGSAIEEACGTLPPGWTVRIRLELDSGTVELEDPEGHTVEYPSNHEKFSDSIRDAIAFAVEAATNGK